MLFLESRGTYGRWISTDAGYHGINLFNIWQMPRMPTDLKAFLGAARKNKVRLWQLSSIKYIAAPANVLNSLPEALKGALNPILYYRFRPEGDWITVDELHQPEEQIDQVLLEYRDSVPRLAVYSNWKVLPLDQHLPTIFSSAFNPLMSVVIDEGFQMEPSSVATPVRVKELVPELSFKDAVVQVKLDQPGIVLFSQKYQSDWNVEIDGQSAELLRCNYIFLGVHVPAGEHEVRFLLD